MKPHINPMTGDSYNSRSVGNWFKKSSFARNIVPRLKLRALRKSSADSSYYAEVEITKLSVERFFNSFSARSCS